METANCVRDFDLLPLSFFLSFVLPLSPSTCPAILTTAEALHTMSTRVYIGKLPTDVRRGDIEDLFRDYGVRFSPLHPCTPAFGLALLAN